MLIYHVKYQIENNYESPVQKANYRLLVIPDTTDSQKITEMNYACSPVAEGYVSKNIYGFKTLNYRIDKPFVQFTFELNLSLEKKQVNPFDFILLSPKEEYQWVYSMDTYLKHHLFLRQTPLTFIAKEALAPFPQYTDEISIFEFLKTLNAFVFDFLDYSSQSTTTETTVSDILNLKKGVCQDYTHLFLAICRENKIPARYVSGYLDQGANYIGSSQLHAWVEALVPNAGWIGFDPTNNLLIDHHYIIIAHGIDYNDCSPITGILEYSGKQKSIHSVSISNQ
jgi:transglutaminase-like putative cysteine protease